MPAVEIEEKNELEKSLEVMNDMQKENVEEFEEMVDLDIREEDFNTSDLEQVKLSNGALKKLHLGQQYEKAILQIAEFNYMPNNGMYQLLATDGKDSSHKICLDKKFNEEITFNLKNKIAGQG